MDHTLVLNYLKWFKMFDAEFAITVSFAERVTKNEKNNFNNRLNCELFCRQAIGGGQSNNKKCQRNTRYISNDIFLFTSYFILTSVNASIYSKTRNCIVYNSRTLLPIQRDFRSKNWSFANKYAPGSGLVYRESVDWMILEKWAENKIHIIFCNRIEIQCLS